MTRAAAAICLMLLIVAPAQAQIGLTIDPETARLINEMELTRLVIVVMAGVLIGDRLIQWRGTAARRRVADNEALNDHEERTERVKLLEAERKEREGLLGLLWAMQGTQVQAKEAILASNTLTGTQVETNKAVAAALTEHTTEAKQYRESLSKEIGSLKTAVTSGYNDIGKMVKDGISEGMTAAAKLFAEQMAAIMAPFTEQIAALNARATVKTEIETKSEVLHVETHESSSDPAGAAAPAAAAGGDAGAGQPAGAAGDEHAGVHSGDPA